jgi:restriction system protein
MNRRSTISLVAALQGRQARKGIFIATSRFIDAAWDYARQIDTKVVLIDGERLTDLMIEHDLGVSPLTTYDIKRVDSDYSGESLDDQ